MGLRMYINEEICFGKLYGYVGNNPHLYSIDYLCSIGAFDDWGIDEDIWSTLSPADMIDYFDCTQCTEDIFLTPFEFARYMCLYISDGLAVWGDEFWSISNCAEMLREVSKTVDENPDNKICIHWG